MKSSQRKNAGTWRMSFSVERGVSYLEPDAENQTALVGCTVNFRAAGDECGTYGSPCSASATIQVMK